MNHAELLKATYSPLRDPSRTRVLQDDVTDYLNDAYVDLATRLEILVREKTGTVGSGIPVPDGSGTDPAAIRVISLFLGSTPVYFTDDATWQSHLDSGSTPSRTLARIDEDSNIIELYPEPEASTAYTLKYSWFPSGTGSTTKLLDDPTDKPALPQHLHRKLVYYAQAEAYEALGEDEAAVRARQKFEQGLPEPKLGRALIAPGPDSLLVMPGPFDRSTSRHI